MKIPPHKSKAQTAVEYLLLLAMVMTLVLIGFWKYSPKMQYGSELYFNAVGSEIVDAPLPGTGPAPINGVWCDPFPPGSCSMVCGPGTQTVQCACPAPANGGTPCQNATGARADGISTKEVPCQLASWGNWSITPGPCVPTNCPQGIRQFTVRCSSSDIQCCPAPTPPSQEACTVTASDFGQWVTTWSGVCVWDRREACDANHVIAPTEPGTVTCSTSCCDQSTNPAGPGRTTLTRPCNPCGNGSGGNSGGISKGDSSGNGGNGVGGNGGELGGNGFRN